MFSIISGALGLLSKIYEAQKTAAYRLDVLNGIKVIESMLNAVMAELKKIEAMEEWNALLTEIKGADGTINNLYNYDDVQNWLNWDGTGTPPTLLDNTIKDINDADIDQCLHYIDSAIMGTVSSSPKWLQLFIDKSDNSSVNTSKLEAAFAFFAGYLIAVQLRGLTLMVAANDPSSGTVKDRLTDKFKTQASTCQSIVDTSLSGDDLWTNDTDHGNEPYNLSSITFIGIPPDFLAEGHAICGFKVGQNGSGHLVLNLYHGKVDSNGYIVGDPALGYTQGNNYDMIPDNPSDKITNNYAFFNANPIEVPEGHVITNIGLNVYSSYEHDHGSGYAYRRDIFRATYFVVKHAAINTDGTIDTANVGTLASAGSFGKDSGHYPDPDSNFKAWKQFNGINIQSTPMTGIKMHDGTYFSPSTKDNIHQKSFG